MRCLSWIVVLAGTLSALASETRPNILLIIADDLGLDKVGVYGLGDPETRPSTPNIDRLAAEGLRFNNFYATPVCSATRATILTGQYGHRNGIRDVILRGQGDPPLELTDVVLPRRLTAGGYDHAHVGKWHLGGRRDTQHPMKAGWKWTAGLLDNPARRGDYWNYTKHTNGKAEQISGKYLTSDTTDDALARIKEMKQPWLLWVAYHAPHAPLHVAPSSLQKRGDADTVGKDPAAQYRTMVEALDTEIGRLLAGLDAKTRARTTVIFLGDNGTLRAAVRPPFSRREAKGTLLSGGCKVPLIVQGFGVPEARRGTASDTLAESVDLYATMLDLAGIKVEGDVHGKSLLPHIQLGRPHRSFAYAEHQLMVMITDGQFRLVREAKAGNTSKVQFYDMRDARVGSDGDNLCPPLAGGSPGVLSRPQRTAYRKLNAEVDRILEGQGD